jgi:hypothetical protein
MVVPWNPCFRHLLLPALRARQDARDRAHREQYAAELRESSRKWEQQKAAKARAKLPQLDLLDLATDSQPGHAASVTN